MENNDENVIKEIEDLPGVGPTIASKLRNAGYYDIIALATANPADVAEVADIAEPTARKIIAEAREAANMNFVSGNDFESRMETIKKITLSSEKLNKLLGGGIETQSLTEFFGEYGSGKTQVAYQLAVNVQLPLEKGGVEGKAVWIDTEGTFRPERLKQIAMAQGIDSEKSLENIKVGRAYSTDHQMLLIDKIPDLINQDKKIKLIIIDSMTALFRAEFVGRSNLADRQQKLNVLLHHLQRIADRFNVAVYYTNQVMARPDILFGDPTAAIGGNIIGHMATYRVYLRKSKKNIRIARLVDSPNLPEQEAAFQITPEGIKDVEEDE
ncbi:MAG: DNA repair and recombination protein RadA [Candidatus Rehaiarchaeum fermentans]|nr:DNA repair and recombination protein RadA [Candidatus Rehaiarchaeum fermentans]